MHYLVNNLPAFFISSNDWLLKDSLHLLVSILYTSILRCLVFKVIYKFRNLGLVQKIIGTSLLSDPGSLSSTLLFIPNVTSNNDSILPQVCCKSVTYFFNNLFSLITLFKRRLWKNNLSCKVRRVATKMLVICLLQNSF